MIGFLGRRPPFPWPVGLGINPAILSISCVVHLTIQNGVESIVGLGIIAVGRELGVVQAEMSDFRYGFSEQRALALEEQAHHRAVVNLCAWEFVSPRPHCLLYQQLSRH